MITILSGISGSGKSTTAKKMWDDDPLNIIIVSRDKIRELLFGYSESNIYEYYDSKDFNKHEQEVSNYQNLIIERALYDDKSVIIDNTNLNNKYILEFLNTYFHRDKIQLIIHHTDKRLAYSRQFNRVRQVTNNIIDNQYNQLLKLYDIYNINKDELYGAEFSIIKLN